VEVPVRARVEQATRHAFRSAVEHPDRSRFLMRAALFETVDDGALPALQRGFAASSTAAVAQLLGHTDLERLRLALVALSFLLNRFGGVPLARLQVTTELADRHAAAEAYVVEVALATIVP